MRTEIRFTGEGGQGVILAAVILAETAAREGLAVVQSEQYGPESRGGHTWADVILANQPIDFPQARELDVLVALHGKGLDRSLRLLKPEHLLLGDSERVTPPQSESYRTVLLPLGELSRGRAAKGVPPNMAALGAFVALTGLVSIETLLDTAMQRVPRDTAAANRRALEAGYAAAGAARRLDGRTPC